MKQPIIYIFRPRNAERYIGERMRSVKRRLADPERRRRFLEVLNRYGIRAAILTPEYNRLRAREAETKLLLYFVPGDPQVSSFAASRLSGEVSPLLNRYTLCFSVRPENAEYWPFDFRMQPDEPNPVLEVFRQLEEQAAQDEPTSQP